MVLMGDGMVFVNKRNKHRNITTALFLILFFCIVIIIPVSAISNSWQIMTVDSTGSTGVYTSLALNTTDEYPSISYSDITNHALKYARWNGLAWNCETVDNTNIVGNYSSLALNSLGYPRISYYNVTFQNLMYAAWDGSLWKIETVDNELGSGYYTSLALDSSNNPCIGYFSNAFDDLKFARWNGASWVIETVDSVGIVGPFTSLTHDGSGNPRISYYDLTNNALKYAKWNGLAWNSETVDSGGDVGKYSSIALNSSDYPAISYYDFTNKDLKYAKWDGFAWIPETIDSSGDVGHYTSLALDSSDMPLIAYYDATNGDLKYAAWDGSSWMIGIADSTGIVGQYSSLKLTATSAPRISYFDVTNNDLKFAWYGTPVAAEFTSVTPTTGIVPLTVQFTDTSTGNPPPISWIWDFGDGNTSTDQNPVKTYAFTGSFPVSLTASGMYGSNTKTRLDYITVNSVPVIADFTATPLSGTVPLNVRFNDTSSGSPTSWLWDFGDGTTSSIRNTSHVFNSVGTFNISLTASNMYGSNITTRPNYITVNPVSSSTPSPVSDSDSPPSPEKQAAPEAQPSGMETVNVGGNSAIEKATVTGQGVSEMVVTAMQLSTLPSGVPSVADPVYQYIGVTPAHFTTISRAVIEFSVPLSWIEEKQTTPASIALARFKDGVWTYLPTTLIREANGHAYFQAESPGFSIFAIVAVKGSVIAAGAAQATEVTTEQITIPTGTVAVPETTTIRFSGTSTTPPPTSTSPQKQPMTILLPLLGAGTALLLRRLQ
jgi:PGF-pre-PGF domain-containing protein